MKLKKLLTATAIAGAIVSAPAEAFLLNWKLDRDGAGAGAATSINEYLDIVGPSYVQTTTPVAGNFTFNEWGAIRSDTHDGGTAFGAGNFLTALFALSGAGNLGGAVSYSTGLITIYSDPVNDFGLSTIPGATRCSSPAYRPSVFSRTTTRFTSSKRVGRPGMLFTGRTRRNRADAHERLPVEEEAFVARSSMGRRSLEAWIAGQRSPFDGRNVESPPVAGFSITARRAVRQR